MKIGEGGVKIGENTSASERGVDALDLVLEIPALLCVELDITRKT